MLVVYPGSSRLQPVLVNLDLDAVRRRPVVVGPEVRLAEPDPVERRLGTSPVGEFLGVGIGAADPFDHPDAAADVVRASGRDRWGTPRAPLRSRRHEIVGAMTSGTLFLYGPFDMVFDLAAQFIHG